jgi:predicted alpha/beta superfamily hydrolase
MNNQISRRSVFGTAAALMVTATAESAPAPKSGDRPMLATIPRSGEFVLPSAEGKKYRIRVSQPHPLDPNLRLMIRGAKPIPIYVLDGGDNFGAAVDISRLMQWGGELPPCVVVAISYENEEEAERLDYRHFDLTPSQNPSIENYRKTDPASWGGAAVFRRFLVQTLQPAIASRFDLDHDDSVLIGHSLAGMFTLDTMVQQPKAFGHYLAMSPSLWFDDRRVLRQLKDALANGAKYPGRLAVYVGDKEERITEPSAHMTSNVLELGRLVAQFRDQFSDVEINVLPRTSHHTVLGPALTQGLQFLISPPERRSETF